MLKLWRLAYRDLRRNRRRSILTLVAVALGMGLLVTLNGLIEGELAGAVENSIRLQTGHVQVREESFDEDKGSLKWEDLLSDAAKTFRDLDDQWGLAFTLLNLGGALLLHDRYAVRRCAPAPSNATASASRASAITISLLVSTPTPSFDRISRWSMGIGHWSMVNGQ